MLCVHLSLSYSAVHYRGCDNPTAGKGRREEMLGGGTVMNKRQEAQGIQGKANS